ncbi:MAG TPA: glycosyltransferase family 39 protein [Thermoleophilaceae bacterium]
MAAGLLVQRRRLAHLRGTVRVAACGLLASGCVVLVHLLPGVLGVLSRWSALGAALLLLALVSRLPEQRPEPSPPAPPEPAGGVVSWVAAAVAAGAVGLWLLASAWNRTVLPPEGIDTLSFHFPVVGKWIQTGTFWRVDQFAPLLANGNYPHTGDVVFLAAILPWRNDWLAGAVNPVFIALAAISVYAIARELRAPRPAALLGAALFASLPVVGFAANGEGMTDSFMFACLGAGILFLLRHERGGPRGELWLAALALGLAFGTKWYAAWAVPAVVAVWLGARLLGRRRGALRDGALVGGVVALAGGFWLVRNLAESGNPLQPVDVSVLGVTLWDAPRDFIRECAGFTIAHYLGDWDAWADHILPVYRDGYAGPGLALAIGLVAAAALAARPPRALIGLGALLAVLLAAGYALTPYSAFGPEGEPSNAGASIRYLVPALLVAAPLTAYAIGRARRLRVPLELLAAAAVAHGVEKAFDVPLRVVALVLLALTAVAAAVWAGLHVTQRRLARRGGPIRVVLALGAAAALVAVGHARQSEFNDGRYEDAGAPVAAIVRDAPEHARIGLAGVWGVDLVAPVWPAFGERVRNEVEYVGRTVDGQLREYDDRASWTAAIRRGRFDLLLVGRGGYGRECPVPGAESDDDAWARAEGFTELARSAHLTLYRVRGTGAGGRAPVTG